MNPVGLAEPVVGLIPAAGSGQRLAPSPCSKEILPIGFRRDERGEVRTQVASHHLFQKFARAGATRAYMILRDGKWDIPAYFGDGRFLGLDLAYVVVGETIGPPDTLDRAYPFVTRDLILFGFPDILFGPDDVFERLLVKLREVGAHVALGLYTAPDIRGLDMVDADETGRVRAMFLKPAESALRSAWVCAVWTPAFTEFMHLFVTRERARNPAQRASYGGIDAQGDLPMGAVIKAAVDEGLRVHGVEFPDDTFVDIGVPDRLAETWRGASIPPRP
jgi:glucose-1-phosphate thymidylyltransferase